MSCFSKITWTGLLAAGCLEAGVILLSATPVPAQQVTTIRRVTVTSKGGNFEFEIDASQPVTPTTLVVTGPDRLVIDFPHAIPGRGLHPIAVNAGQVKGIRMGLFESTPPTARVVVDLKTPQAYELFPSGNKVIVKLASGNARAAQAAPVRAAPMPQGAPMHASLVPVAAIPAAPPPPQQPHAEVELRDGKLSIRSERATLSDILHEVQRRTGATLAIPPGAGGEAVITQLGPAPVRDVLAALLDGSSYNVVLLGSGRDRSSVTSIILTSKGGGVDMPANISASAVEPPPPEAQAEPPAPDPPPPVMDSQSDTSQQAPPDAPPPDAVPPPPPPPQ
jgi:hypothetical protein